MLNLAAREVDFKTREIHLAQIDEISTKTEKRWIIQISDRLYEELTDFLASHKWSQKPDHSNGCSRSRVDCPLMRGPGASFRAPPLPRSHL